MQQPNELFIIEGRQYQRSDEEHAYAILTTPWGGSPTSVAVTVRDTVADSDVTSVVMPTNSPSVSTDTITTSLLKNLTAGRSYRIDFKFTSGGSIWYAGIIVDCPF